MKKIAWLITTGIFTAQFASASIISLYEFNGTTEDSVRGAGNQALLVGGTAAYTTGKSGQAFNFNGSTILKAPLAGAGLSNFSFSAWVNFQTSTGFDTILKNWGASQVGAFHLGLDSGGNTIESFFGGRDDSNGDPSSAVVGPNVTIGNWIHVGVTLGNATQTLYVNGLSQGTANTPFALSDRFGSMSFGAKLNDAQDGAAQNYTGWLDGYLDDVAFFDQALTPTEMSQVYNAGVQGNSISNLGFATTSVPEPSTFVVSALFACGMLCMRSRKSRKKS